VKPINLLIIVLCLTILTVKAQQTIGIYCTESAFGAQQISYDRKPMTGYFFSVDDTSGIVPSTRTNVRLALLSDKQLDNQFELAFPDDASLKTDAGEPIQDKPIYYQ
jgi:hypothetical protein